MGMVKQVEAKASVAIARTKDYPQQVVKKGAKFPADDKRVKNNPAHFEEVEAMVESATAAPGETRKVTPRKEKKAAK